MKESLFCYMWKSVGYLGQEHPVIQIQLTRKALPSFSGFVISIVVLVFPSTKLFCVVWDDIWVY